MDFILFGYFYKLLHLRVGYKRNHLKKYMKKILHIVLMVFIVSCSPSKEEQLIRDYEEIDGNTRTNLNLKFEKIEFVMNITNQDSLRILKNKLNNLRDKEIKYFENMISTLKESIKKRKESISEYSISSSFPKNLLKLNKDLLKIDEDELIHMKKKMEPWKKGFRGTYLEDSYKKILDKYKFNLESILLKKYNVIYTFKNPKLNNTEQTITKKYYFNPDLTKILKVEND